MKAPRLNPVLAIAAATVTFALASQALAVDRDLEKMESRLVRTFRTITPSVVGIQTYSSTERMRMSMSLPRRPGRDAPEAEKKAYERKLEEIFLKIKAQGSGFVYDREGHIVTTTRAVPAVSKKVHVVYHDGTVEKASVVGRSETFNVVLLKVKRRDLPPARLGGPVRLGQMVATAGNSFDIAVRMRRLAYSLGTVTGLYNVKAGKGYTTYYAGPVIETDAAINPGNFGGPLIDLKGHVVGLVCSTFDFQRWLGTAVPIARVVEGVNAILNPSTAGMSDPFPFDSVGAALVWKGGKLYVSAVSSGGLAKSAGVRGGDRVLLIDGRTPTPETLAELLSRAARRGTVELRLERDGWEKTFSLALKAKGTDGDDDDF